MLNYFLTVLQQIFSMFLMVMVGFIMRKMNLLTEKGTKDMSNLLLKVVTPMVIISAYQRPYDGELLSMWFISFGAAVLVYAVAMLLAELFYRDKQNPYFAESKLGVIMPNCGFLAFPLIEALSGELGIFFGSPAAIILNIIMWSYGVKLLNSGEKIKLSKMLISPGTISVAGSLLLFCSPWKLPEPVFNAVNSIGALNTPVAMIILGAMLANANLSDSLKNPHYYKIAFLRLIATPAIILVILKLLPIPQEIELVALVDAVVPTATVLSIMSQLFDRDYRFASNVIVLTTVLSAVTMPIILTLGKMFLGY